MRTEEEIRDEIALVVSKLSGNPYDPEGRAASINPLAMRYYLRGLKWVLNEEE